MTRKPSTKRSRSKSRSPKDMVKHIDNTQEVLRSNLRKYAAARNYDVETFENFMMKKFATLFKMWSREEAKIGSGKKSMFDKFSDDLD
jgi:CRISPR/Cas system CMR subunit Cmr6 (Cas7 group RAMP superfamily)